MPRLPITLVRDILFIGGFRTAAAIQIAEVDDFPAEPGGNVRFPITTTFTSTADIAQRQWAPSRLNCRKGAAG
jgi:hypothetical protein